MLFGKWAKTLRRLSLVVLAVLSWSRRVRLFARVARRGQGWPLPPRQRGRQSAGAPVFSALIYENVLIWTNLSNTFAVLVCAVLL
jgi:hypothetical protein